MSAHLAFIDINETDQVKELRVYLRAKGASDVEENGKDDFIVDLKDLIGSCGVSWRSSDASENEIEAVMNSFISLIILVPNCDELVTLFCQSVTASDDRRDWDRVRLRVLCNLFNGFNEKSLQRATIYRYMVKFAGRTNQINFVPADLKQIKEFVKLWNLSKAETQNLLRDLHDAYIECGQKDSASRVMIELLGSYTESTASQAKDDACKCIVTSLADPNSFLLDHLLTLKPVKSLEGEKIYELMMIFVTGTLKDYEKFYSANKDFMASQDLDHNQNLRKMRLLTFMHLAENRSTLDFDVIERELGISPKEVEQFIIDAVKTKTVMAKIDLLNKKVSISSSTQRTFAKQNWVELNSQLAMWRSNLEKMSQGFQMISTEVAGLQ